MGISAAVGGAALIGGGIQAFGAQKAASAQKKSAMMSAMVQQNMFNQGLDYLKQRTGVADQAREVLNPFIQGGTNALTQVQQLTGTNEGGNPLTAALTRPFQPTMEELANTPGYQFTLQQGLNATQNAAAAKGLGTSGAALRGAADYAEGLAGTTYQQQFQNYLAQNSQIYNMLNGQVGMGQSAAGTQAGLATQLAGLSGTALQSGVGAGANIGGALVGAGNAQAAGALGTANALAGGIQGGVGGLLTGSMLQGQMPSNSLFGSNGAFGGNFFGQGSSVSNISPTTSIPGLSPYSNYGPLGPGQGWAM